SDDACVGAFFHHARLAERDGEVRARIFRAVVGLAIKMLVLQEHHWIVAADRSAQEPSHIQSRRRHNYTQAGTVGENRLPALAVINAAAGEIASDGDTEHGGRFEVAVRAPPKHAKLISDLHHRRPDVVEELDFGDRLQTAGGHANRAPDYA